MSKNTCSTVQQMAKDKHLKSVEIRQCYLKHLHHKEIKKTTAF